MASYKVEALIRIERLQNVSDALMAQGLSDFCVMEVRGHGSCDKPSACFRRGHYDISYFKQKRIELIVQDVALDGAVECIMNAALTGGPGDGKILVTSLANVMEIRLDQRMAPPLARPNAPGLLAPADNLMRSPW